MKQLVVVDSIIRTLLEKKVRKVRQIIGTLLKRSYESYLALNLIFLKIIYYF